MFLVTANELTATQRRVYFHLVDATDGITPETGEAAGQPQISTNGGAWTNTGIGTLTAIGNGRYYADLTQAAVATVGDVIETRYKSAATAETPGTSVHVVAFDPHDVVRLGLTALPNAAAGVSGGLGMIDATLNARADVRAWRGTGVPVENTAGYPIVTVKDGAGVGEIQTAAGQVEITGAQIAQIVTDMGATLDDTDTVVNAVWNEDLDPEHITGGTAGKALIDAGAGGGGGGLTAQQTANAVWNELRTTGPGGNHTTANTFGAFLDAAISGVSTGGVSAGDIADAVWDEVVPGSRTGSMAGKILGDNLNATVASRATQASLDIVDDLLDTEIANIQSRLPASLTGGKMESNVGSMSADTITSSAVATGAIDTTALAAGAIHPTAMATGAIHPTAMAAGSITPAVIAAGAIDADAIADDAIDGNALATSAITKIQAGLATAATGMTLTSAERNNIADAHFARPLPTTPTVDTAGEALQAARAQGFGRWSIVGNVLALYASNGTTVLKTFTLAPAGGPFTSRTP